MLEISLVSGTYNRIDHLKDMVRSFRKSIGYGIPYEIVLVDGGSTDGTQAWCKEQKDIVLIEQKKLLGAVKAFNAGAFKAIGKYVILGNDDITFIDESILNAYAFMQDNPNVGIGCFWQDRGSKEFHVEYMSAVRDGKQVSVPYGQVCIVPKYLGDKVGWWGDYLHTYAGDNELSCRVLELGYEVKPLPCASIHDIRLEDNLREANHPNKTNEAHPDSVKWVTKWTRNGKLGANIQIGSKVNTARQTRWLYAPIYEPGFPKYKSGLLKALAKHGSVVEVDYVSESAGKIFDVANAFNPDIILTQIHDTSIINTNIFSQLQAEHPKAIFINWNGDCFPENCTTANYMSMMAKCDLALFVQTIIREQYIGRGIKFDYWQIGFEPADRVPDKTTKKHDVLFLGNGHYDFRQRLGAFLRNLKDVNVGIYGSWKNIKADGYNLYDYNAGGKLYANCKIAISDTRPNSPGFVSNRVFEAMASGAFVLQEFVPELCKLNGFEEGKHIVFWSDYRDLKEKIYYYIEHEKERKMIAQTAKDYVHQNFSFDAQVEKLIRMMRNRGLYYNDHS